MTLTYAITACNEVLELNNLINQINSIKRPEDNILIQLDEEKVTEEMKSFVAKYNHIFFKLNNDFGSFKNNLLNNCKTDYILFLDADELLSEELKNQLYSYINHINNIVEIEVVGFYRLNTLEGSEEDIKIYKSKYPVLESLSSNKQKIYNFPDVQFRLLKTKSGIKWEGKVHEKLFRKDKNFVFFHDEDIAILHNKNIKRQLEQNELYLNIK